MALDDALDNGQADAGALELFVAVQSLESAKEFFRVAHVKARAVVLDEINLFSILLPPTNFYDRLFLACREFEGI